MTELFTLKGGEVSLCQGSTGHWSVGAVSELLLSFTIHHLAAKVKNNVEIYVSVCPEYEMNNLDQLTFP